MHPDVPVEVNGKIWSFEIAGINDVLIIISSVLIYSSHFQVLQQGFNQLLLMYLKANSEWIWIPENWDSSWEIDWKTKLKKNNNKCSM